MYYEFITLELWLYSANSWGCEGQKPDSNSINKWRNTLTHPVRSLNTAEVKRSHAYPRCPSFSLLTLLTSSWFCPQVGSPFKGEQRGFWQPQPLSVPKSYIPKKSMSSFTIQPANIPTKTDWPGLEHMSTAGWEWCQLPKSHMSWVRYL